MIRPILGWFRIRRNDPILISVCLLVLLSLALPIVIVLDLVENAGRWTIFDNGTLIGLMALGGTLLGLSAIFANPRSYRRFDRLFSLTGVMAMVMALYWVGSTYRIWDGGQLNLISRLEDDAYWIGWRGVAALLGLFLSSALLIWLMNTLARPLFARIGETKVTRTRLLIGTAIVLFAAATLKNILGSVFADAFEQRGSMIWIFAAFWCLCGVLLPSVIASRTKSFWYRSLATVLFCGGSAGILIAYVSAQTFDPTLPGIAVGVFSALTAIPLIVVQPNLPSADDGSQAENAAEPSLGWSLLWSGLAIAVVVSAIVMMYRYDPLTLYTVKTANRWTLARQMRTFNTDSATDFYGVAVEAQGTNYADFQIRFSEKSDKNYMDRFEGFPLMSSFTLLGIHSEIELASLPRATPMQLQVFDSRLNHEQLNVLLNSNSHLRMSNVEFSGESGVITPALSSSWVIEKTKPGEIAKILSSVKSFSGVGSLRIYDTNCDLDDWKQIVRASQECPVYLSHMTLPEDLCDQWQQSPDQSLKNLTVQHLQKQAKLAMQLAFDTDANVKMFSWKLDTDWPELFDSDHYWALVLVCGELTETPARYDSTRIRRNVGSKELAEDLNQVAEANYWSMAKSESGTVESFYFPGLPTKLLADLKHFPDLKRMSLDWSWVNEQLPTFGSVGQIDFSLLGNLTKLESLHLPTNFEPQDLLFLSKLPNLTELQISPNRTFLNKPGFEQCKLLKKLTLLNSPVGQVLKEINTLKSLEELTIVDFGYKLIEPKTQAAFRAKFPRLKITIIDASDYKPMRTEEFEEHVAKVKTETRERFIED